MIDRACTLIDRFWWKAAAACLGLAAVVAVIAFASQSTERDPDQVRNVLRDFVTAAGDRDGEAACDLLTENGRRAVMGVVPGTTCEQYARSFGFDVAGLGGVYPRLGLDLPDRVVVDGTNTNGPDGKPIGRQVAFVRTPDGFRIDGLSR
ncbi:hypothetical protein DSM112329_03826 [Paraconexibacter sp. AEG42_29]|uniref:Uncharacterized protein n=1 Tax=Paraconexibacter sp. AEG42_29 TaxID=2997339 RepID=A0AAU7AZ97_9ACTN